MQERSGEQQRDQRTWRRARRNSRIGAGDTEDKLQQLDKTGSNTCECMAQTYKKMGIVYSEARGITSFVSHFQR